MSEFEITFKTSNDFDENEVFIEDISLFLFATTNTLQMDAHLYLKVNDGGLIYWQLITPNTPVTNGDSDHTQNVFKLKLFEQYDELITLIPNREYKIEINFYNLTNSVRYMSISDNEAINDGKCDNRLDCDLEGFFEIICNLWIWYNTNKT